MLELLPLGQKVKKWTSDVTSSNLLQVKKQLEGSYIRDFFSMKDNAEAGRVEKPGFVITYKTLRVVFIKNQRWMVEPEI